MKARKEMAAANRHPGPPGFEKGPKALTGRLRIAGGWPSENVRRQVSLGVVLATVLSFGVFVAGAALLSGASAPESPRSQEPVAQAIPNVPRVGQMAPDASIHSDRISVSISSLRGKKIMLWLLSTWCGSCVQGVLGLARVQPDLARAGIEIVALRNYGNGGYAGPSLAEFIGKFGPPLLVAPNWILGEASQQLARRYNPRGYPDIYFLIDGSGVIRAVDSAPSFTIDKILRFAAKGT